MDRSKGMDKGLQQLVYSFQAELEEMDPLPLCDEPCPYRVVDKVHGVQVSCQLIIGWVEIWEVGGSVRPGESDFRHGALVGFARD